MGFVSGPDFNFDLGYSSSEGETREWVTPIVGRLPPIAERNASDAGTDLVHYLMENQGFSAFIREDGAVYHTYSTGGSWGGVPDELLRNPRPNAVRPRRRRRISPLDPPPRRLGPRLGAPRLEEFNWIARWILDEDLAAAGSLDDLTSELRPLSSETLNGRVEIRNHDLEPIPPTRLGNPAGFARATHPGLVKKQSQVILPQTGEPWGHGKVDLKPELVAVEVHRLGDVCDEVPDRRLCHVRILRSLFGVR